MIYIREDEFDDELNSYKDELDSDIGNKKKFDVPLDIWKEFYKKWISPGKYATHGEAERILTKNVIDFFKNHREYEQDDEYLIYRGLKLNPENNISFLLKLVSNDKSEFDSYTSWTLDKYMTFAFAGAGSWCDIGVILELEARKNDVLIDCTSISKYSRIEIGREREIVLNPGRYNYNVKRIICRNKEIEKQVEEYIKDKEILNLIY
jgi:hypothetical protein